MTDRFPHVFSPGAIGTLELPHRVLMGAMHLGLETRDDGGAALAAFYTERVRGGVGLIITGGAAINPAGAGGARYGVLTDPAFRARLGHVAERVHAAGGLIALQLFHAGRYAPGAPVAPSPVFSRISGREPRPLTDAEIHATIDDFARGASYARELGFDAVEVMGSEGYLIDQFLSPLTNTRDDEWGGDPTRRPRFGIEVTRAVRDAVGAGFPVIVRFSGADLMDGGVSRIDTLRFARGLAEAGADGLDIGVGWHESPVPTVQGIVAPGAWAPVAAAVRDTVARLPVIASNRINRLEVGERILAAGQADFVSLARPFLADPQLVRRSRQGEAVNVCIACNQACIDRSLADDGDTVSCLVNPRAGREDALPPLPRTHRPARVAVIGGGPAGLLAARELAVAGHDVTLFEATDRPGGQFRLACRVPGKADYAATVDYLAGELAAHRGALRLGRPVTADDLDLLSTFDGLIVATGVRPRHVDLPGTDLPHVLDYHAAFATGALGQRVAIIGGGGIATDLAHYASQEPRRTVHVLHRGSRLGARIGRSTRWVVLGELRRESVHLHTQARCQRISADGVEFLDQDGKPQFVAADTVVIAVGQEPDTAGPSLARRTGRWHRVIGGARDAIALDAVRACAEGAYAAREFAEHHASNCAPTR